MRLLFTILLACGILLLLFARQQENSEEERDHGLSFQTSYTTGRKGGPSAASSSPRLTLVLPVIFRDISRSLFLLHTLRRNLPAEFVEEMLIIAPKAEATLLNDSFKMPWPVQVLDEASLLPSRGIDLLGGRDQLYEVIHDEKKAGRGPKYYLQMLLKLSIAEHVKTRFYLVLDSDVLLLHPLRNLSVLLPSPDKASYLVERRASHPEWWANTEAILQLSPCADDYLFGVTPAILARDLALATLDRFTALYGDDMLATLLFPNTTAVASLSVIPPAVKHLARHRNYTLPFNNAPGIPSWTEYGAYRTVACQTPGLFDAYHELPSHPTLLYGGYWYEQDFHRQPPPCNASHVFCVVQTHAEVPNSMVFDFFRDKLVG